MEKLAELNAIFLTLNDKGEDSALMILKSLDFARVCYKSATGGGKTAGNVGGLVWCIDFEKNFDIVGV